MKSKEFWNFCLFDGSLWISWVMPGSNGCDLYSEGSWYNSSPILCWTDWNPRVIYKTQWMHCRQRTTKCRIQGCLQGLQEHIQPAGDIGKGLLCAWKDWYPSWSAREVPFPGLAGTGQQQWWTPWFSLQSYRGGFTPFLLAFNVLDKLREKKPGMGSLGL